MLDWLKKLFGKKNESGSETVTPAEGETTNEAPAEEVLAEEEENTEDSANPEA